MGTSTDDFGWNIHEVLDSLSLADSAECFDACTSFGGVHNVTSVGVGVGGVVYNYLCCSSWAFYYKT